MLKVISPDSDLNYILSLGVKLTKIHGVLQFEQKAWLKPYIDKNTILRQKAKDEFEKDFFKIMNNSVFGKTMENVKNRMQLQLTSSNSNAIKLFSQPHMKDCRFQHGLYMIEIIREEIEYDKRKYVGTCV